MELLRQRGVAIPAAAQSRAYYLEMCRSRGITELSAAEMETIRPSENPPPADRQSPTRRQSSPLGAQASERGGRDGGAREEIAEIEGGGSG